MFGILIIVFIHAVKKLTRNHLIYLSCGLSLSFVVFYQIIGFLIYPGLVKDLVPFSFQHLLSTTMLFGFLFGGHCITFFIISLFKRFFIKA